MRCARTRSSRSSSRSVSILDRCREVRQLYARQRYRDLACRHPRRAAGYRDLAAREVRVLHAVPVRGGLRVGPQFVRGVAKDGVPQALFAVVVCLLVLGSVMLAAMLGWLRSRLRGGSACGIADHFGVDRACDRCDQRLGGDVCRKLLIDHIPVAYAVTYIWGTVGTGWILGDAWARSCWVSISRRSAVG